MKKLTNKDKIFSLFEVDKDKEIYKEAEREDVFDEFLTRVGTLLVGVENYEILDKIYTLKYRELYSNSRKNIKKRYFNSLFEYIKDLDLEEQEDLKTLSISFKEERFMKALNKFLIFFQEKEEYEKCATIQKLMKGYKVS